MTSGGHRNVPPSYPLKRILTRILMRKLTANTQAEIYAPSILSSVIPNTSFTPASVCSPVSLIPESFPLSPGCDAPSPGFSASSYKTKQSQQLLGHSHIENNLHSSGFLSEGYWILKNYGPKGHTYYDLRVWLCPSSKLLFSLVSVTCTCHLLGLGGIVWSLLLFRKTLANLV